MGQLNGSSHYAAERVSRRRGSLPWLVAASLGQPELTRLPAREQEIATIVYLRGEATPKEIEQVLGDGLSNSAIRSMLSRLVAKGVLKRRKEGKKYFYLPGVNGANVREKALHRVTEDYFGSSYCDAMVALLDLVGRHQPESLPVIARQFARASAMNGGEATWRG
jgi:predicted transcriptional regulator